MRLDDLDYFAKAVEAGGFAAAARLAGCPKSTISKRVNALESALGVQLIARSSRSFRLTDVGREVFEHARAATIAAESARAVVARRQAEPAGPVRITASVPTAQTYLAARLPLLALRLPALEIAVHITDRFVDLPREGFDIALRSHFAPLPDSTLISRTVATDPVVLVASPAYLEGAGPLDIPEQLTGQAGLLTRPDADCWRLTDHGGNAWSGTPRRRYVADESQCLLEAAKAGLGIVALPGRIAAPAIGDGSLRHVLPAWTAGLVTTTLLTTHRRGQLPAVRAVADFLCDIKS